jgi:L-fucose isomerase-like protein
LGVGRKDDTNTKGFEAMLDYKVKIALAPVRRWLPGKRPGIFNPEYALKNKKKIIEYLRRNFSGSEVELVDLDFLNEEGMMYDISQAETIAAKLNAANVDGMFIINCNFGCEEVAGKVAQLVKKPTLIWAPRDTIIEADGTRYTDAQCGFFAMSRQLQRYGIPFSHIENCNVDDVVFQNGFQDFLAVICMVKNFHSLRIAQVGLRPKPFNSVMINEAELMEKFGIEIVPINMAVVIDKMKQILSEKSGQLAQDVAAVKELIDVGDVPDQTLTKMMAFKYLYREIAKENNCRMIATECWTAMMAAFDAMPCVAMSLLGDERFYVTCESDIYGAISMALLSCATRGKSHPIFGEFTMRHPQNENAELLWHCGPFPYSTKNPRVKASLYNARPSWEVKPGPYTIARFELDRGQAYLLAGECQAVEGPYTFGTYLWAEFDDYTKWERRLIEGPYIHHVAEIEGRYSRVLKEFCKYVPGLKFDSPD